MEWKDRAQDGIIEENSLSGVEGKGMEGKKMKGKREERNGVQEN